MRTPAPPPPAPASSPVASSEADPYAPGKSGASVPAVECVEGSEGGSACQFCGGSTAVTSVRCDCGVVACGNCLRAWQGHECGKKEATK